MESDGEPQGCAGEHCNCETSSAEASLLTLAMPRELGFPDHMGPGKLQHSWTHPASNDGLMAAPGQGTCPLVPMCVCWQLASGAAKESCGTGLSGASTRCATRAAWAQAWRASPCGRDAPGSGIPPDALHRRDRRMPFVRALHSLLGNLPGITTSPAPGESSGAGGAVPAPAAQVCHRPPARSLCMGAGCAS